MESISEEKRVLPMGNVFDAWRDAADPQSMPSDLSHAAELLMNLAHQGYTSAWQDASEAEHIPAQRAAIELCRRALNEIEVIVAYEVQIIQDDYAKAMRALSEVAA